MADLTYIKEQYEIKKVLLSDTLKNFDATLKKENNGIKIIKLPFSEDLFRFKEQFLIAMNGYVEYIDCDNPEEVHFKLTHTPEKTLCCKCGAAALKYIDFAFNNSITVCGTCETTADDFMEGISLNGTGLEKALGLIVSYYSQSNGEKRDSVISHERSYIVFVGNEFEKKAEIDAILIEVMCRFNNKLVFGDVQSEGYEVRGIFDKTHEYKDGTAYCIIEEGDVEREKNEWCPSELKKSSTGNHWYPIRKVQVWS